MGSGASGKSACSGRRHGDVRCGPLTYTEIKLSCDWLLLNLVPIRAIRRRKWTNRNRPLESGRFDEGSIAGA